MISLHDPDDKDLVSRRDLANFWHLQEERKKRDAELGQKGSFKQTDSQKEVLAEAKRNVEAREAQRFISVWKLYLYLLDGVATIHLSLIHI